MKEEISKLSYTDTAMEINFIPMFKSHNNQSAPHNNPPKSHNNSPTNITSLINGFFEGDDDNTPVKKLKLSLKCLDDKGLLGELLDDVAVAYLCKVVWWFDVVGCFIVICINNDIYNTVFS